MIFDIVVAVIVGLVIGMVNRDDEAERREHARAPKSVLPAFVEPEKHSLKKVFEREARESAVPIALLEGLAWRESRWRAEALNPESGAIGIGQLLPETATYVANEVLREPDLNPYIGIDNIRLTARYVRILLDGFGGDERLAIASYLQGSTSVKRDGVNASTADFVTQVQAIRRRFQAALRGDRGSARDPLTE